MMEQLAQKAQNHSKNLGSVTIHHPFHPLCGQSFPVLKIRSVNGIRRYSLQSGNDIISVPETWLVDASTNDFSDSYFNAEVIRALTEFASLISE